MNLARRALGRVHLVVWLRRSLSTFLGAALIVGLIPLALAFSATGASAAPGCSIPDAPNKQANDAVCFAYAQLGSKYQIDGCRFGPYSYVFSPGASCPAPYHYDCSGLVAAAYASVGMTNIATTSQSQYQQGPAAAGALEPGDLLYFHGVPNPTHVAMYVGGGDGHGNVWIIEAPQTGVPVHKVLRGGWSGTSRPWANTSLLSKPTPLITDVAHVTTTTGKGHWELLSNGFVASYGDAKKFNNKVINALPLVKGDQAIGMKRNRTNDGLWVITTHGRVYTLGKDVPFFGNISHSAFVLVDIEPHYSAKSHKVNGYWALAADGGVFTKGPKHGKDPIGYHGNALHKLSKKPFVIAKSIYGTGSGKGYVITDVWGKKIKLGDAKR